ncbi:MAG: CHAD domain-containing protein [Methylococcales bacterium]|nr:CHAD domain-containing protein [Methylococcales bacterium]
MESVDYRLPYHLTAKKLLAQLASWGHAQFIDQHYTVKTYYDSFDWRLYQKGLLGYWLRSPDATEWCLESIRERRLILRENCTQAPKFAGQFNTVKLNQRLRKILDNRALIALTELDFTLYHWTLFDAKAQPVAQLHLEQHDIIPGFLRLSPLPAFQDFASHWQQFCQTLIIQPTDQPSLVDALKVQGRKPLDYTSKFHLALNPATRSDLAVKEILNTLLNALKRNEQGVIEQIDPEFLHDYRVAIRRTRAGLGQLKGVLPKAECRRFRHVFASLGQLTNTPRDLDVYLEQFDTLKAYLPEDMRTDLQPVRQLITLKHQLAHEHLKDILTSRQYQEDMLAWETFLNSANIKQPLEPKALWPIKKLAHQRINRIYQEMLCEGHAIDRQSPPEQLHELRKTGKKLRYLLEFFQSLYPTEQLTDLLKWLKKLQDVLGGFQDLSIQEQVLAQYSQELAEQPDSANTLLAIGALIHALRGQRRQYRESVAERFQAFSEHSWSRIEE